MESAEPPSDSTPLLTFHTVGQSRIWELTDQRVSEWLEAYPNLDVLAECRRAFAWIEAHPEKRKTAKGMPAFLVSWLNRAVDHGRGGNGVPESRSAGNISSLKNFVNRGQG